MRLLGRRNGVACCGRPTVRAQPLSRLLLSVILQDPGALLELGSEFFVASAQITGGRIIPGTIDARAVLRMCGLTTPPTSPIGDRHLVAGDLQYLASAMVGFPFARENYRVANGAISKRGLFNGAG